MYGPVGKVTKFMYDSILFKPKLDAKTWTDKDSRLHFTGRPHCSKGLPISLKLHKLSFGERVIRYISGLEIKQHLLINTEGKKHDAGVLRMSGLYQDLERHSWAPDGTPLCIYGDAVYP